MKKNLSLFLAMIFAISMHVNAQDATNDKKVPDTVNRTDASGNMYGYWIEKRGELTFKGQFAANKKIKDWVGYYPNNMVFRVEYYTNGIKEGIALQFDRKGKISLVEHFKNGLNEGQSIYYSAFNEQITSETEYVAGKKNGLYRQFYENSKIQEESMYKDDLKNGLSRWNNKNGQRIAEYNYKAGNFDGLQKTFYENDSLQTTNYYIDNKLAGESKEYYRNGKLKVSGKYVNGLKEGPWTEYDELGKVATVTRFKEGEEVRKK
ncbi:MAG: hypothetical protein NT040_19150 [Bacteroidetes bacterium]|nr:hypothetical protein [Bacteroidota bacterium]